MIEEVDELDLDENGTNTTGHQMSVLVREQIEKFKGKMIDEIEGSPPVKRGFAGNISTDGLQNYDRESLLSVKVAPVAARS